MTTVEEALEQGWRTPLPTFFGPLNDAGNTDAFEFFRQCPGSFWSATELSEPKQPTTDKNERALTPRPVRYARLSAIVRFPYLDFLQKNTFEVRPA